MSPRSFSRLARTVVPLIIVYMVATCTPALAAETRFDLPSVRQVPVNPTAMRLADLNDDGRLDVVISHRELISVTLAGDDRVLAPTVSFDIGDYWVQALEIEDVDEDSHLDAVVALGSDGIALLRGDGTGGFGAAEVHAVSTGAYDVAVLDWNGDGHQDLVTVGGVALILLGDGLGGFAELAPQPALPDATRIDAGDLDGDGIPDLVVTGNGVRVNFLDANGDTRYSAFIVQADDGSYATTLEVTDLDVDGHYDVVFAASSRRPGNQVKRVVAAYGNGDGTFNPVELLGPSAPVSLAEVMQVGDFTGDGLVDVAVESRPSPRSVFLLRGLGQRAFVYEKAPWQNGLAISPNVFAYGDVDGDGRLDIATASDGGFPRVARLVVVYNPQSDQLEVGETDVRDLASAATSDIDNDGTLDLVLAADDAVSVHLGDGLGGFTEIAEVFAGDVGALALGDFDGNGWTDIAVARPQAARIAILLADGLGGYDAAGEFAVDPMPRHLTAVEVNGDAIDDLAVLGTTVGSRDVVEVFAGVGGGAFASTFRQLGTIREDPQAQAPLRAADLDGNGTQDMILPFLTEIRVLLSDGAGDFATHSVLAGDGSEASGIDLADFDEDGTLDLVLDTQKKIRIYTGDGAGGFALRSSTPKYGGAWIGPSRLVAADFDDDGHIDVATLYEKLGILSTLRGDGTGALTHDSDFDLGGEPLFAIAANLDPRLDDRTDVLLGTSVGLTVVKNLTNATVDCRKGWIDAASGTPADVLFVNDLAGTGDERRVELGAADALQIRMDAPPSRPAGPSVFALYATLGTPGYAGLDPQPHGVGLSCIPTPLTGGPTPKRIWNNTGKPQLGSANADSSPAPSVILDLPNGTGIAVTVFLQGILADTSAPNGKGAVTNGIEIVVK